MDLDVVALLDSHAEGAWMRELSGVLREYQIKPRSEILDGNKIPRIDTHGNAYLNAPGVYVHIKGGKDVAARTSLGEGQGSANPAVLRVAFVLLSQPMMVDGAYVAPSYRVSLTVI